MHTGNVVKWDGGFYIVQGVQRDYDGLAKAHLIPIDYANMIVGVSRTFPTKRVYRCTENDYCGGLEEYHDDRCAFDIVPDETKTIQTVEVVADTIKSWIMKNVQTAIFGE